MTTTRKDIEELRAKELARLQTPEPHPRPRMVGAVDIDQRVDKQTRAQYGEWRKAGEQVLNNAADRMETDHAFATREGLARAQFEVRSAEKYAIDAFNGYADEPGRAAHELLVAEDRLANAVDEYIEHYEDPELDPTPEMVQRVEELNHDVVLTEEHHHAIHNNGLPLDPPLDTEREQYIRETTKQDVNHSAMTRDQYIEQTTQPSHGRPADRSHSR